LSQNNELLACYKVFSLLEAASDNAEAMLDSMPGAMVVLNQDLRVIRANNEFSKLSGCTIETVLGFDFTSLFSPENKATLLRQLASMKSEGQPNKPVNFELEIVPPKESLARQYYWQASVVGVKKSAEGELISISGKDLTDLYQSEMKLKNIFSNLPLGMLMIDSEGKIQEVLSQFSEVLFNRKELVGVSFVSLFESTKTGQDREVIDGLKNLACCFGMNKNQYANVEHSFPRVIEIGGVATTQDRWISINYQPILKLGRIEGFILLIEDATESIHAKKEMERVSELERQIQTVYEAAIRDPLTGLYTRLFMKDSLKSLISNFHRGRIEELSVLMMDVDHFKTVNDTYGHKIGDRLLSEVGKIILKQVRETDIAIRFGGEEFLIILPSNFSDMTSGKVLAERIRMEVEKYELKIGSGEHVKITISGGVSWCGKQENIDHAIERADSFLYLAKRRGRNCIVTETDR
jgi:two-component system, cell cycle response regulator